MPTPPSKSKRIIVIFVATLLLLTIGYQSLRKSPPSTSPERAVLAKVSAGDSSLATNDVAVRPKEPEPVPSPKQSLQARARRFTDQPNKSTKPQSLSPAEPAKKPAPVACDQLVLRNGDLVDVTVNEVGISEIRYKKCRWPDGPDYAVLKSEVLSIRFANGDIERFTGQ